MSQSSPLVEIVYISAACRSVTTATLRELLAKARNKNRRVGVTGMLLHIDGSFLQVLEGDPLVVDDLYRTIHADKRHNRILRLFRTTITHRSFPEWTMGFVEPDAAMRQQFLSFNTFVHSGTRDDLGAARTLVKEIATQFKLGRWRQQDALATVEQSHPPGG